MKNHLKKHKKKYIIFGIVLLILLILLDYCGNIMKKKFEDVAESLEAKPVIYLYPEEETNVSVKLDYNGDFICTYPEYNNGWEVIAKPDGTLLYDNQEYNYLFWEGNSNIEYDFSKGFCVKGSETRKFLEEKLLELGLNRKEANEFIVYWLPKMQNNEYNVISFQTDVYTNNAKLEITPTPDTTIRIFMAYYPSNEMIDIKEQEIITPIRQGFTVVEWGGSETKNTNN